MDIWISIYGYMDLYQYVSLIPIYGSFFTCFSHFFSYLITETLILECLYRQFRCTGDLKTVWSNR